MKLTRAQFHRGEYTVKEVKDHMANEGLQVRQDENAV